MELRLILLVMHSSIRCTALEYALFLLPGVSIVELAVMMRFLWCRETNASDWVRSGKKHWAPVSTPLKCEQSRRGFILELWIWEVEVTVARTLRVSRWKLNRTKLAKALKSMWIAIKFYQLLSDTAISYCKLNRALEIGNIDVSYCPHVLQGG